MKRLLALFLFPLSLAAQTATINGGSLLQPIDGFGASGSFMGNVPSSIINTEYSSTGMGFKYMRIGIVPTLTDCQSYFSDCITVSSGATVSAADLANAQTAAAQGATIWLSSWSPRATMKSNGVYGAGGNMLAGTGNANYTTYAADLASGVAFMAGYGIPVYAISVQNEPEVSEAYPSCLWTAQQIHDFVPYLRTALNAVTGGSSVKIVIAEPGVWETTYAATAMNDSAVASQVGILAGHAYNSTSGFPPVFLTYANITSAQHQWETEVSDQNDTYDGSMTSGLFYGSLLHNYLVTAKVSAWYYFGIADDPACRGDNSGLTNCAGAFAKRAYVMGNYARCATGNTEIAATATPQSGVLVTAFKNISTGAFCIVALNNNSGSVSQPFSLTGGLSASSMTPILTNASNNLVSQSPITVTANAFTATLSGSSATTFFSGGSSSFTYSQSSSPSAGGSIAGCSNGTYSSGTGFSCSASANSGYTFTGWTGTGSASGCTTGTCAFSITANTTLQANFASTSACGSSSPYTAASSAESDVNSCINGPGHVAVNGDVVQIPCSGTQSVTWASALTIPANITLTALGATPNAGASTFGAGTNCLTIVDNVAGSWMIYATPKYSATSNVLTIQNINIDPVSATTALLNPITIEGTGTASGMPQARIDNIVFGKGVQWTESGNSASAVQLIKPDNVIGVADHNTLPAGSAVELATINMSSYLGVGQYGDNSWAQADSMGTANNWFDENNLINAYIVVTDATEGGPAYAQSGGGRVVNRYNHVITNTSQFFQITGVHGLDSTGRPRSVRHTETYGNTVTCAGNCSDATSYRGGTGVTWGNTLNVTGSGFWAGLFDVTVYRTALGNAPFSYCGGLATASGGTANPTFIGDPWDTIDNTTYYTGTMTTSGSGVLTMTDSSKSFPTLGPAASGGVYSVYDTTQGWVSQITSNTATSITVLGLVNVSSSGFNSGDSYKIIRATVCADQGGRGQGAYISTDPPPATPLNEALDPIYEWDDTMHNGSLQVLTNYAGQIKANRDFYTDNWRGASLSGPTAQTSATAPFNGSTTCNAGSGNYTCGVGFGTLALRPTTCTIGVGYFATDQGQGQLFKCTSTNTWTFSYAPYTYPHPLAGGSGVSLTVNTAGSGTGTVTGTNSTTGSYASGTTIGPLTATATGGSTFTGWTVTGNAACSGTTSPCPSFNLTSTTTVTANFSPGTSTCANPFQNAPNYSGGGSGSGGSYPIPPSISVGFTSPTSGCSMFYTADGSTPTCSSTAYPGGGFTISTATTITYRVIACQAGYASSAVQGGTWVTTTTGSVSLTISTIGTGSGTISGPNCASGAYTSGTLIGPCTANAASGSVFTGWTSSGSASCTGTGACPSSGSFALNQTSTITATFNLTGPTAPTQVQATIQGATFQ